MSDNCSLKYKFSFETKKHGFPLDEVKAEGAGGCDALVITSIVRDGDTPFEGSKSFMFISVDGFEAKSTAIPLPEMFQALVHMAAMITGEHETNAGIDGDPRQRVPLWQYELAAKLLKDVQGKVQTIATKNQKKRERRG